MPIKAVQQFMLGTVLNNEQQAKETLAAVKAAGYDGIELCGFMIHPIGFVVKLLTKAAGMPVGKGGNLDWHKLVQEAGLKVVSLHTDLGSLERDAHAVAEEAKSFGTEYVVITGMYRFDYGDEATMHELAKRLNKAGETLQKEGIHLLYHNHNCELRHVHAEKRAYDILQEETDPQFVNFEFDSYWFTEGGANALLLQRGDLVLLQSEQGRKNEGQLSRLVEESRELEKERFAAAGAEAHENVAVLENAGENLALFRAKLGHAELTHGGVYIIIIRHYLPPAPPE